ncbi:MAG: hypothetical protein RQ856_05760 [Candidatus Izemoplasmatales bacterium]|nr:hypothetical protein [Candidatus Izemoplasmatales bacterium]
MKKLIFSMFLFLSFLLIFIIKVAAYSPHYLPGGKNYISSDNAIEVSDIVSSINPFLVKSYTDYTFSVSRDYVDGAPFNLNVYFYDNDRYISEVSADDFTMSFDITLNVYYFTFKTPAESNYLEFDFNDNGTYVSGTELINVQLEEGLVATAYEPYIQGDIIDTSSPYFIGSNSIISYYDQPITVAEIQSSLSAYDDIDGDLSANIMVVQDNYTANIGLLGTYSVIFSVTDNSMNSTEMTVNVQLVDILAPVFSNVSTITAVYPNTYTVQEIISMLSASDNYDADVSHLISLVKDNYTINSNIVGTYQMDFQVTDSSGNTSYYTQDISVVDVEGPVISGNETINIGYNYQLTSAIVMEGLSVIDNYDDQLTLNIVLESDNYTINYNKLGQYSMQFSVTDSSGNKTYKTINIAVVDEIGPVVYFDSSIIQVYSDTVLSLPDFAQLLVKTNELNQGEDYYITIKYDNYTNHAQNPGTYHLSLDFEDSKGDVLTKEFQIRVIDRGYDYIFVQDHVEDKVQESFWQQNMLYTIGGLGFITASSLGVIVFSLIKKRSLFSIFKKW